MKKKLLVWLCCGLLFCCASAPLLAIRPLDGVVILLDPGHGGSDPGAIGPTGLKESETNLRVARYLKMLLVADGARVHMTREGDTFLSLPERVAKADELRPDLFVSIHHNASLKPKTEHRGEIYFNALDQGLPLQTARSMERMISTSPLASGAIAIPGGFFVLRNSPVPAVLTEASYISVPENEKALKLGRALTEEAQAFRLAIREVFVKPPLRVTFFTQEPCHINTAYFNIIFAADKPISNLEMGLQGPGKTNFRFERVPAFGPVYSLTNLSPLPTGEYQVTFRFSAADGSHSPPRRLRLDVKLPVAQADVHPVAPYIPRGMIGKFPIRFTLKDVTDRDNPQALPFSVNWKGQFIPGITQTNGQASVLLDLDGTENEPLAVSVQVEQRTVGQLEIPVLQADKKLVVGRVVNSGEKAGVEGVKIHFGANRTSVSGPGGYFSGEIPSGGKTLRLDVVPPLGYTRLKHTFMAPLQGLMAGEIVLEPVASGILGKNMIIIAAKEVDALVRPVVKHLMMGGVRISRMVPDFSQPFPESWAVARANNQKGVDLILSVKETSRKIPAFRHYYRSATGKKLAGTIKNTLQKFGVIAVAEGGSDYELSHSGPPALVMAIPRDLPDNQKQSVIQKAVEGLVQFYQNRK
jgi:N-acetylmuramoyl-L-alanine amidase